MKKIILSTVITAIIFSQVSFAQDTANQSMQKVISAYLGVKNALVQDNGNSVRAASKILFNAINDIPMEKLSVDQHKIWMQYSEKLSYDAEHMKQTDDLEHQREHFSKLSVNFYKVLKALSVNTSDLYYQFCPMANDGKGAYWLSETEKISNPYFGNKMPKCGTTKETLRARK